MASTQLVYYVNTVSTSGGDGTTNTTSGASRAFSGFLEAWTAISTNHPDIVTEDVDITVHLEGGLDNSGLIDIRTVVTDETHTIKFIGPEQDWDITSGYILTSDTITQYQNFIYLASDMYIEFVNLKITTTVDSSKTLRVNNKLFKMTNCYIDSINGDCAMEATRRGVQISNCIVKSTSGVSFNYPASYFGTENTIVDKCTFIGDIVVGDDLFIDITDTYANSITASANTTVTNVATSDSSGSIPNIALVDGFVDPNNGNYTPQGDLLGAAGDGSDIGPIQVNTVPQVVILTAQGPVSTYSVGDISVTENISTVILETVSVSTQAGDLIGLEEILSQQEAVVQQIELSLNLCNIEKLVKESYLLNNNQSVEFMITFTSDKTPTDPVLYAGDENGYNEFEIVNGVALIPTDFITSPSLIVFGYDKASKTATQHVSFVVDQLPI